ncbi:hypothetical protein [Bradyrhizobium sp.]|uniref:hypothetical protein n=1 Tax=Bradyrhizobium sp. TaxID=376 RepID=UPI0040377DC3
MRTVTAYFAGVGTVAVAIAAGLGGGLLLGDIMSPQQPKHQSSEVTRLEQRASPQPIPATNDAAQPVPDRATGQAANTAAEPPQPAQPQQAQPQPPQPSQQTQSPQVQQNTQAQATAVAAPANAGNEQRAAPEDSFAKARDADLKREARRAEDKRKYERRQQWTDKRKWRQRQDEEMREVEAGVREDSERRPFFGRREARFDRGEPRPMFGPEPGFGRSFSPFDFD